MLTSLVQAAYVIAAVLFILSLAGLSKQETARRGSLLVMGESGSGKSSLLRAIAGL